LTAQAAHEDELIDQDAAISLGISLSGHLPTNGTPPIEGGPDQRIAPVAALAHAPEALVPPPDPPPRA
jgi:hypothetical protein